MDAWVERYRAEAETLLAEGYVQHLEFSGSTYLAGIFDPMTQEIRWPVLQFDEKQRMQDAFCSCPMEDGRCVHLAAAYLQILGPEELPLHIRFERSFWNHLCRLFGDHSGYEERFIEHVGKGRYTYQNEVGFEIRAKTKKATERLSNLIENRLRETPENSIKFSNLSISEIARWREGRPGPALRYALSFWADLAKWMLTETSECSLSFEEDDEGFPTIIVTEFPSFSALFELKKRDLKKLIPYLESVPSSLKLFQSSEEQVKEIAFDPKTASFHLSHSALDSKQFEQKARYFESWAYVPGQGFYSKNGESLLSRRVIEKDEAALFLDHYADQITHFIPVHEKSEELHYEIYFDREWNWHFVAYLFEKGDLLAPDTLLLGRWVYLPQRGFYAIDEPLFEQVKGVVDAQKVSHFVNHHRIWLNSQEGFQTHLASVESRLSYSVTEDQMLRFHTKVPTEPSGTMDFGDWIYYAGLGFFSKKHARLGLVVRPGIEIESTNISAFIKANREELEVIPGFFTTNCPLSSRGLEITRHSLTSLQVKPVYMARPEYEEAKISLFGDFSYLEGEGFCELPAAMRLPDGYAEEVTISQAQLSEFFDHELPYLMKYTLKIDGSLRPPHKMNLAVNYLVRSGQGLKAQLFVQTERGNIGVTELLEAIANKRRYLFSEVGLLDLQQESFQWLKNFKNPYSAENQTVELSTLDLIRLDALFGLLAPTESSATAQVSRNLLQELREFTSHETPNLKGLTSTLRLYQSTGLHWLWFLYRNGLSGLLCDDMGLGKTHQAMALIAATLNQKSEQPKRYLIVCPTSVIYHWEDKLTAFLPHVKVHTFHGLKRSLQSFPTEGILLTSYGILRVERKKFQEIPFELAIFDEVQVAKNPQSKVHDTLKMVQARMRIGLTGTPIENNLKELKALFDLVLPGYMPSEARFRELFVLPIERDGNEEKKALLSQLIRPFILRRRKSEVLLELPDKSEDKFYCDLSEDQVELYRNILSQKKDSVIAELRDQNVAVNYVHVFSLLSQLKQVCDHPALIHKKPQNYKDYSSGKWELFTELLEEARESEQKVVVFSQYLFMLDIMKEYLKERGWGYAQIRGDTLNRREELRRFQEDPECVVFIGSLQAAGLGIDLTAASVVILYDRWWNAARENQAIDRVHRMGQKWGVQVYKLITKHTIEEKIDEMITRKGKLLEEVIAADDQEVLKNFSRSDLIDLLSFTG